MECSQKKYYNSLDFARLVCALLVVTIHFPPFGFGTDSHLCVLLNHGIRNSVARLAVPFFFMTSGFLLYRKDHDRLSSNTKRYIIRLLKLYVTWTVIYSPFIISRIIKSDCIWKQVLVFIRDFFFVGSYLPLWYLPATIFATIIVSYLLLRKVEIKTILLLGLFCYFIGVFDDSWYGVIPNKLTPFVSLYNKLFYTTRNGLFEGILFISMGAYFAMEQPEIKHPVAGLFLSLMLFIIEFILVTKLKLPRDYNLYFMLVPSIFFIFHILLHIEIHNKKSYYYTRPLSALVFFSHVMIGLFSQKLFSLFGINANTSVQFVIVVLGSVLFSFIIIKLSEAKYFHWLKNLFS